MRRELQRIVVISDDADPAEFADLKPGKGAVLLVAPTGPAKAIATTLGLDPSPQLLLAPVPYPDVDRSRHLEALVRNEAAADRYRDVLVVADRATTRLIVRAIGGERAPVQSLTVLGLPRARRPVNPLVVAPAALGLGIFSAITDAWIHPLLPAALCALVGLAFVVRPPGRRLGLTLLATGAIAALIVVLAVASSARFPTA